MCRLVSLILFWGIVGAGCAPAHDTTYPGGTLPRGTTGGTNSKGIPYISTDPRVQKAAQQDPPDPTETAEEKKPEPVVPGQPKLEPPKPLRLRFKEFEINRYKTGQKTATRFGSDQIVIVLFFHEQPALTFNFRPTGKDGHYTFTQTSGQYTLTGKIDDNIPVRTLGDFTLTDTKSLESAHIFYNAYKAKMSVHEDTTETRVAGSILEQRINALKKDTFGWVNDWAVVKGMSFYLIDIVTVQEVNKGASTPALPLPPPPLPILAFKGESLRTGEKDYAAKSLVPTFAKDVSLVGNGENAQRRWFQTKLEGGNETTEVILDFTPEVPLLTPPPLNITEDAQGPQPLDASTPSSAQEQEQIPGPAALPSAPSAPESTPTASPETQTPETQTAEATPSSTQPAETVAPPPEIQPESAQPPQQQQQPEPPEPPIVQAPFQPSTSTASVPPQKPVTQAPSTTEVKPPAPISTTPPPPKPPAPPPPQPAKPTTPPQPAKPTTPPQPAKPATPPQPAKPATPPQPAKPAAPPQPAKPATTPKPPVPLRPQEYATYDDAYLRIDKTSARAIQMDRDFAQNINNPGVQRWIGIYTSQKREDLRRFYKFANPFRTMMEAIAKAFQVATSYAYLTVSESAYFKGGYPINTSEVGAHGPFQFMYGTAPTIGVSVTGVDERAFFAPSACGGAKYIVQLVDAFANRDMTFGIMGYFAGQGGAEGAYQRAKNLVRRYDFKFSDVESANYISQPLIDYVDDKLAIYFISNNMSKYHFTIESGAPDLSQIKSVYPPRGISNRECSQVIEAYKASQLTN